MARKPGNPGLKGRLIERSVEAYILALETINRLSVKYRLETFTYLMCNAWELLLKAKILEDSKNDRRSIYYPKQKGQRPRTLALRDCLKTAFPNEKDPIRRNTELVADLRDEACHLVIRAIPPKTIGLCQACVRNYHSKLGEWFSRSLSDQVPLGMMTLVYDFDPSDLDLGSARLKRELGRETAKYLMEFEAGLQREYAELGKPAEFSIDIEYKLALTKRAGEGDIVLSAGTAGIAATVVEVPKDPAKTHPYRQKHVIEQVHQLLPGTKFNTRDMDAIKAAHNVKANGAYSFHLARAGAAPLYSQAFVDWVVGQIKSDPSFLQRARAEFKKQLRNRPDAS